MKPAKLKVKGMPGLWVEVPQGCALYRGDYNLSSKQTFDADAYFHAGYHRNVFARDQNWRRPWDKAAKAAVGAA